MSAPFRPGITALIPTSGEDVVAIFEQSDEGEDTLLFEDAHLIQANVNEHVSFYTHPLENGRSLVDHRIIQPVTIDLKVLLIDNTTLLGGALGGNFFTRARDVYEQIRKVFLAGTLLRIQTRTATYSNQVIQSMPHEETSAMFDGVALNFNASEILFESANVAFAPADETNSDTVGRGKINPTAVVSELAESVKEQAATIFGV